MSNTNPEPFPLAPLIVVSGPSGVGKTTVVEELLRKTTLPLRRAITATTRLQRQGEANDISYHFLTHDQFLGAIAQGKMLEWAEVFGTDLYGTPRSEVDSYRAAGTGVILVIDVQGAARIRELCSDCLSVFVRAPNFEVLEQRLRARKDTTEDKIQRRLAAAHEELARANEFDAVIINEYLDHAVADLERLVRQRFPTETS